MPKRWIDLSQPIFEGMAVAGPMPRPRLATPVQTDNPYGTWLGEGVVFRMMEFTLSSHLGTHIDAPRHFYPSGKSIDQLPFDKFVGPGVCLSLPRPRLGTISAQDLEAARPPVQRGDIVLVATGWAHNYGTEAYYEYPGFTADAARWLIDKGVSILGVDTFSPDVAFSARDRTFDYPVHRLLLGRDILIIENLGHLESIAGRRAIIAAFPINIKGADSAQCRAFALVED